MKLNNKLIVVIAILLFITIRHTYNQQEKPVVSTSYSSEKIKDTNIGAELFSPSKIILVKLP